MFWLTLGILVEASQVFVLRTLWHELRLQKAKPLAFRIGLVAEILVMAVPPVGWFLGFGAWPIVLAMAIPGVLFYFVPAWLVDLSGGPVENEVTDGKS